MDRAFKGAGRKREMPGSHAKETTCLNKQERGQNGPRSGTKVMEEEPRGARESRERRDEGLGLVKAIPTRLPGGREISAQNSGTEPLPLFRTC